MSLVTKPQAKPKAQQNYGQYDDGLGGNLAGMDGLGEVGRPDWMEDDSSDDGKLMDNRNNFDLKVPDTRKLRRQQFITEFRFKVFISHLLQF